APPGFQSRQTSGHGSAGRNGDEERKGIESEDGAGSAEETTELNYNVTTHNSQRSSKNQGPNLKQNPNANLQDLLWNFPHWCLEFVWNLVLVIWSFSASHQSNSNRPNRLGW